MIKMMINKCMMIKSMMMKLIKMIEMMEMMMAPISESGCMAIVRAGDSLGVTGKGMGLPLYHSDHHHHHHHHHHHQHVRNSASTLKMIMIMTIRNCDSRNTYEP